MNITMNKKTIISFGIILGLILVVFLTFSEKLSVKDYQKDVDVIQSTMYDLEGSFVYLLGASDKSACKNWIKTNRKDMKSEMKTKLGAKFVDSQFDLYEVCLKVFDEYGIIGNHQLAMQYLKEIDKDPRVTKANDKAEKVKTELFDKAGL